MKTLRFIFSLCLVFPLAGEAISRVGNGGIRSHKLGYSLIVPKEFSNVRLFENENARLLNIMPFRSQLNEIDIRNFAQEFPEYEGQPVEQIENGLVAEGWNKISKEGLCGDVFYKESKTTNAFTVTWGQNKGYVLVAGKAPTTLKHLNAILDSTVIDNEACKP